ncbi:MAG: DMT family transporter [Polyangiaceae bacterium]
MNPVSNVIDSLRVTVPPTGLSLRKRALAWSALGMLGFSFTLTATRAAVPEMGGVFVGFGRAVVAAAFALATIWLWRLPRPSRSQVAPLLRTALGVVVGFPALSALALRTAPASHAQVFLGLSPLATALVAATLGGEKLPSGFWRAATLGGLSVLLFAWLHTGGQLGSADALLVLAVALVGLGYAEGGRLAREMGGLGVVCWALVLALPITLPVSCWALGDAAWVGHLSLRAALGFGYVSVVSMFLAFVAWYRGLGMGSVARISQIQLVMPLLGLLWAALLLGEHLEWTTLLAGALVSLFAFIGNWRRFSGRSRGA